MPKTSREIPRVNVRSRHSADCKQRGDRTYLRCDCPKQLVYFKDGKEHRDTAGTRDYQAAEQKARELERRWEQAAKGERTDTTVAEAVELYLTSKRSLNYEAKSHRKLEMLFRERFVQFCDGEKISFIADVTLLNLEKFRATWKQAASTRGKFQGYLTGFFDWCERRDLVSKNVAKGLEKISGARDVNPTIALTDAQFSTVLDAIDALTHREEDEVERVRCLALLQRWSGLAIQDAVKIERSRFVPMEGGWYKLLLRRAKTGVEVFTAIPPAVAEEILSAPSVSPRYIFWDGDQATLKATLTRFQIAYKRVSETANLTDHDGKPLYFHSHQLRDSYAIWCFMNGLATEDVAALLGHSNIKTTQEHYSPWIAARQQRLAGLLKSAYAAWSAEKPTLPAEVIETKMLTAAQ